MDSREPWQHEYIRNKVNRENIRRLNKSLLIYYLSLHRLWLKGKRPFFTPCKWEPSGALKKNLNSPHVHTFYLFPFKPSPPPLKKLYCKNCWWKNEFSKKNILLQVLNFSSPVSVIRMSCQIHNCSLKSSVWSSMN